MTRWRIYLGLSLTIFFWGASFIASKVTLRALTPASITTLRFGIGLLLIIMVLVLQGKGRWITPKEITLLAILGS